MERRRWLAIWGRLVREGGETCLPFSEIGGLIFGARALMLGGVDLAQVVRAVGIEPTLYH